VRFGTGSDVVCATWWGVARHLFVTGSGAITV
jgi:hypothetical protein